MPDLARIVAFVALICLTAFPAAARTATEALVAADSFRLPFQSGEVRVLLKSFEGDNERDSAEYRVLFSGGNSLIELLDPRVRGQRVLMTDAGMWLYVPNTRRSLRITPLQRLMGEASYGDIARMVWQADYTAEDVANETIGVEKARRLRLTARNDNAVYAHIDLWVSLEESRPLKADYFLASGKLIKSAEFAPPVIVTGKPIVTEMVFVDGIRKGHRTIMKMDAFAERQIPASHFTPAGLEGMR